MILHQNIILHEFRILGQICHMILVLRTDLRQVMSNALFFITQIFMRSHFRPLFMSPISPISSTYSCNSRKTSSWRRTGIKRVQANIHRRESDEMVRTTKQTIRSGKIAAARRIRSLHTRGTTSLHIFHKNNNGHRSQSSTYRRNN